MARHILGSHLGDSEIPVTVKINPDAASRSLRPTVWVSGVRFQLQLQRIPYPISISVTEVGVRYKRVRGNFRSVEETIIIAIIIQRIRPSISRSDKRTSSGLNTIGKTISITIVILRVGPSCQFLQIVGTISIRVPRRTVARINRSIIGGRKPVCRLPAIG